MKMNMNTLQNMGMAEYICCENRVRNYWGWQCLNKGRVANGDGDESQGKG